MTFPPPTPTGGLHGHSNPPTAAILIIGNEILSGKTKDANISWIAAQLKARGIKTCEVRIVPDTQAAIVSALNALRQSWDFVFTTGGIGPTHDDITSESISAAFGLAHVIHPQARARMEKDYAARGIALNDARLRMATMPEGAELLQPRKSTAPGFKIGNVFCMAGIPAVMQDMWEDALRFLPHADEIRSVSIACTVKEGDLADDLSAIQDRYPEVEIGSYPVDHGNGTWSVTLMLTATDQQKLTAAAADVQMMVERLTLARA